MPHLFYDYDGHALIEHQKKNLKEEISNLREEQLKGTNIEEWVKYYKDRFTINVPEIDRDGIEVDVADTKLDARGFRSRIHFIDDNRPVMVEGNTFTVHIPYSGDKELFKCRGNRIHHNSIDADIHSEELTFVVSDIDHNADKVNSQIEQSVNLIDGFLRELRNYFQEFNNSIEGLVRSSLTQRIDKFNKDDDLKSKLKFNIKKRGNTAQTYKVPEVRKKVRIIDRPSPKKSGVAPEPELDAKIYNEILEITQNMSEVMEKSPSAFKQMDEEALRQHFLVQLNGQFEGGATGETFNYEGKTDILITHKNKKIFIAECKYWKGPQTLPETIDQLLGYTSWRDTKTAILLFNRNKNLSKVLGQIPGLAQGHSNYDRDLKPAINQETEFRYIFKHKDDPERKLFLTILVFDVPN